MLPIIAPGIVSGALFAFITPFDEVVIALFIAGSEQRTLPRQMWSGVRDLEPDDRCCRGAPYPLLDTIPRHGPVAAKAGRAAETGPCGLITKGRIGL